MRYYLIIAFLILAKCSKSQTVVAYVLDHKIELSDSIITIKVNFFNCGAEKISIPKDVYTSELANTLQFGMVILDDGGQRIKCSPLVQYTVPPLYQDIIPGSCAISMVRLLPNCFHGKGKYTIEFSIKLGSENGNEVIQTNKFNLIIY